MKYKLIALDVDGTLLNDDHQLSAPTIETIRQVHESGATIVLCTGRGPGNAIPVMEELGLEGTIITHNGAATVRTADRAILHHFPFEAAELEFYVTSCRKYQVHFDVSTPFQMHVDYELPEHVAQMYVSFMIQPIRERNFDALPERPVKFSAYSPDKARLDRLQADWLQADSPLVVLRSGDFFMDVMHPKASKGNALRALCQTLGVERSEVLAMGNYFNDADMLQFAGWGIAMANSPEDVKRLANEVTVSNNEGGVYRSLLKHCF